MTDQEQSSELSRINASVRPATEQDVNVILGFIKELAEYEKEPDAVKTTPDLLKTNLFGPDHVASALIAEVESKAGESTKKPIGFALYFFSYSTWTGVPSLYLEDLYVSPTVRNRGAGKALFRALGEVAKSKGCARMDWSVLTWNAPSIAFYEKVLGATRMEEWRQMRLETDGIDKLASLQ